MLEFLVAVVPSAGALFLLWVILRAVIQADRRERLAEARWDAQERARQLADEQTGKGAEPASPAVPSGDEPS